MTYDSIDAFRQAKGQTFTSENWFEVSQEMVNDFSEATKDYQWIHTDVERAKKESPFGGPIAHGFLSLSLIPKLMGDLVRVSSIKMGINYGLNKVRFPNAVPVGSLLRCHCTVAGIDDYANGGVKVTWQCVIEIKGQEKPACVAEMLSLMFE